MAISNYLFSKQGTQFSPTTRFSSIQAKENSLRVLPSDVFREVLSFLEPEELVRSEKVCRTWNRFSDEINLWKRQCQNLLGLSPEVDPKIYVTVPESSSYKEVFQMMYASILGKGVYERYIGKVGLVPRIPESISLRRWNDLDPCDPTKKIGREYVWIYVPTHITIKGKGYSLSGADDPNDPEAPQLIQSGERENTALKVPVTINNLKILFEHPIVGNPSTYSFIWDKVVEQYGDKRWSAGWVCMRKDVIARGLPFDEQQELAASRGVCLSTLLPRILFNFLEHSRSGTANIYPDRRNPWTYARTATFVRDLYDLRRQDWWPLGCGGGNPLGLHVYDHTFVGGGAVGVAVALPEEVQATHL